MDYREIKTSAMTELKRLFRPEFLNRVDEIVVFHSLEKKQVSRIFDILIKDVEKRLAEREIAFEISKKAKDFLIDKGFDVKFGARPLRRTIQQEIEDPLSVEILRRRFAEGSKIVVSVRNGKLLFSEGAKKEVESKEEVGAAL